MVRMTTITPIEYARSWAETDQQRDVLQTTLEKMKLELDNVKIRQETMSKQLRALIGPNTPQRLFDIGAGKIVLVSVERGVQLVQGEKADG